MQKIKTHIFNGNKYLIDLDTNEGGFCDNPKNKIPTLAVFTDL